MNLAASSFVTGSLVLLLLATPQAMAALLESPFTGRWDCVVRVGDVEVPFPFEIDSDGGAVRGSFFNGKLRITSTEGRVEGQGLTLNFDQYATKLVATLKDGELAGEYQRTRGPYPFRATRAGSKPPASENAPDIAGVWVVKAQSKKGEVAWRFIVRQIGADVEGTLLRVDGDTGTLSGSYRDGRFVLSHFAGSRPLVLEATLSPEGTLALKQNGKTELIAARENTAGAAAIGVPTDPSEHTTVKDPSEPFRFAFKDLQGNLVSNTDPKFNGKVVLVNISGSWCPNCHDEAPFLVSLYGEYQSRGLEIVTLSFEGDDQLDDPWRLRAFIKTYGIDYTVLLAGEPDEASEKIPQAIGLDSFPTTFLLGRQGRVRAIHAGFPSPGSGDFYVKAEREITSTVERLLTETF